MTPILYIMCGPSGCGKTTWAKKKIHEDEQICYVSRDNIRYSMVKEDEPYFKNEKKVFKEFIRAIANYIAAGQSVIADATHLNEFSRRKLTQALDMYTKDYQIIYVVPNVSWELCKERNSKREGRERVPETVLSNMFRDFRYPSLNEDERAIEIMEVDD